MSNLASEMKCNKTFLQKAIGIRKGDEYNNSQFYLYLPILSICTMDEFSFKFDFSIDFEGVMFAFSIPYLRVWVGYKNYKYFNFMRRLTKIQKERMINK